MPQKEGKVVSDFKEAMSRTNSERLSLNKLQTLQVNMGNICNQRCAHCHIQAGPDGKKIMPKTVMVKICAFLRSHPGLCVDITGGCPELNPDFKFFLDNVYKLVSRLMVRTNLTVFFEPGLDWVPVWYSEHKVVLIASLPCYTEQNVKKQRGGGVFRKSIEALKMLNELGYGINGQLELNLVYNPGGDFLPAAQDQLEAQYKNQLHEKYGIRFNKLFTMTNAPIGRFKRYLQSNDQLQQYQVLLAESFNPVATENVMCRNLVSVDYRGLVYNCDFNQALDLPIIDAKGSAVKIETLGEVLSGSLDIITGEHCFCCTAGAGSSCTGAVVK
ncbi:MAG: arsenosugar biosynthesis radical SAM (seleno)protein ArsS [Planctomycetota bacterium]|jgi:radical SAM/Cys-rich protein